MNKYSRSAVVQRAATDGSSQRSTFRLEPAAASAVAAVCLLLVVARLALTEGDAISVALAVLVCSTTGSLILLVTRRPLFSAAAMLAQVLVVTVASWVKLKHMNMVLHAYDLFFYLTSGTTLGFLLENYRLEALLMLGVLVLVIAVCVIAWRVDPVRIKRSAAAVVLLLTAAGAVSAGVMVPERRHLQFEYRDMLLSSFYRSWTETIETLWRGQLIEAAATTSGASLRAATACNVEAKPPHIILVHQESVVPPSILPNLAYDRRLDDFFRSDDGQSYRLKVETYGGASVLTEFSVFTGLSTYSFGGMRLFVQRLLAGKLEETIPKILSKCGYRNVMFYPMLKTFTSADKFFTGIGIEEIFDAKSQKARRWNERDSFYYDRAVSELDRHLAASDRPLFAFIETMATHWPYHLKFEPHLDVPGGGAGTDSEMHEYLRRLWLAHLDYEHLRAELARRFPSERFLIVRYGDHHPMATRMLLGYKAGTDAEDVSLDRTSVGFQTFFAVNGVGFAPKRFYSPPLLDVPYLGTVLLTAAGLPLSDAHEQRQRLKIICGGLWFDCPTSELVLGFHRQFLDAGLLHE